MRILQLLRHGKRGGPCWVPVSPRLQLAAQQMHRPLLSWLPPRRLSSHRRYRRSFLQRALPPWLPHHGSRIPPRKRPATRRRQRPIPAPCCHRPPRRNHAFQSARHQCQHLVPPRPVCLRLRGPAPRQCLCGLLPLPSTAILRWLHLTDHRAPRRRCLPQPLLQRPRRGEAPLVLPRHHRCPRACEGTAQARAAAATRACLVAAALAPTPTPTPRSRSAALRSMICDVHRRLCGCRRCALCASLFPAVRHASAFHPPAACARACFGVRPTASTANHRRSGDTARSLCFSYFCCVVRA